MCKIFNQFYLIFISFSPSSPLIPNTNYRMLGPFTPETPLLLTTLRHLIIKKYIFSQKYKTINLKLKRNLLFSTIIMILLRKGISSLMVQYKRNILFLLANHDLIDKDFPYFLQVSCQYFSGMTNFTYVVVKYSHMFIFK